MKSLKDVFSIRGDQVLKIKPTTSNAPFPMINTYPHGMPLGGLGAGTFSINPLGHFNVWHFSPGVHVFDSQPDCFFATTQKVLGGKNGGMVYEKKLQHGTEPNNLKPEEVKFSARYPLAWHDFNSKSLPVQLTLNSFSPVIAHNYQESSYPVAIFNWLAKNKSREKMMVSIKFQFGDILSLDHEIDKSQSGPTHHFVKPKNFSPSQVNAINEESDRGYLYTHQNGQICVLGQNIPGITYEVLPGTSPNLLALQATFVIMPGQEMSVPMVLAWDIPRANQFYRFYTRFFGVNGLNAFKIAKEALLQHQNYLEKINQFQEPVLNRRDLPDWFKATLFNELYYLVDGGTIWEADFGRFSYLECFDYPFYETLDVRYYGSMPLALFWPEIEKNTMREFAKTISKSDESVIKFNKAMIVDPKDLNKSKPVDPVGIDTGYRKVSGAAPHDLGTHTELPWQKINAYLWRNSNRWKDLNPKFILQIYRIYFLAGHKDQNFLKETWPAVKAALEYMKTLDSDQDELPENENFPDQTFDNWTMKGTSAYCAILTLSAYRAAIRIAERLGEMDFAQTYREKVTKGKESLTKKLWNGKYFKFDETCEDVMSAQLMGHWYLDLFNLTPVFDVVTIKSVLKSIVDTNLNRFFGGRLGAVNGRTKEGLAVDKSRDPKGQGSDIWVGINYALASHLLKHGLKWDAWKILKAMYRQTYQGGYAFRTPESWDEKGNYIASMYMRPGAIWAVII